MPKPKRKLAKQIDIPVEKIEPEEVPLIENVIALLQEFLAMGKEPAAEEAPEMIEAAVEPADEEEYEETDVDKAADAGTTGDSDAEERLDDNTDITDESLSDIGKAAKMLTNMFRERDKKATKSLKPNVNVQIVNTLTTLTKELKKISTRQDAFESFAGNITDAMGYSDEVIKSQKTEMDKILNKDVKPKQANQMSSELIRTLVKSIYAEVNQGTEPDMTHPFNTKRTANKDMHGVIDMICKK